MSERKTEVNRRRHRREKLNILKRKLVTATVSERKDIASKVRALTPGADVILANWGLTER